MRHTEITAAFLLIRLKGSIKKLDRNRNSIVLDAKSIVHFRGFKFNPTEDCSRLYLKYAPHGNLEATQISLSLYAKILTRSIPMASLFLFAQVCVAMQTRAFGRI